MVLAPPNPASSSAFGIIYPDLFSLPSWQFLPLVADGSGHWGLATRPAIDPQQAHEHSSNHRSRILASEICGCFYCKKTFPPSEVEEWVDEVDGVGQTALCPRCVIDSVIGSASGIQLTPGFLGNMHRHWF